MLQQLSMRRLFSKQRTPRWPPAQCKADGASIGENASTSEEIPVLSEEASRMKSTRSFHEDMISLQGRLSAEMIDIDELLRIIEGDDWTNLSGKSWASEDPGGSFTFRSANLHSDQSVASDTNQSITTLRTRNVSRKKEKEPLTSFIFLSLAASHHGSTPLEAMTSKETRQPTPREIVISSLGSHLRMIISEEDLTAAAVKRLSLPVRVDDGSLMLQRGESALSVVDNVVIGALVRKEYQQVCEIYETLRRDVMQRESPIVRPLLSRLVISCILAGYERKAKTYCLKLMERSTLKNKEMADALMLKGFLYFAFNDLEKALNSWREAVYKYKSENKHSALLWNNLACLQSQLGDMEQARASLNQSIAVQNKELRNARDAIQALLNMAITKSNLAVIAEIQQDYDGALDHLSESMLLQESTLSESHLTLVNTKEYLHHLQCRQQNAAPEELLSVNPASLLEKLKLSLFGDVDGLPLTREVTNVEGTTDLIQLGPLMNEHRPSERVQGAFSEVFDLLETSAATPVSNRKYYLLPVEADGNRVIKSKIKLSGIYQDITDHLMRKEINPALGLLKCCLRGHRDKYGVLHPLVALTLHNIGIVLLLANRYEDAILYFEHAAIIRIKTLGIDHGETCASLMKLGLIQVSFRHFDNALVTLSQILHIRRKTFGYLDPQIVIALNNIACVHFECGGLVAATKSLEEALEILRKLGTTNDGSLQATATLLCNQGFILTKRGMYEDSLAVYLEAFEIQQTVYPTNHSTLVETCENIESVRSQIFNSREMDVSFFDFIKCDLTYQ